MASSKTGRWLGSRAAEAKGITPPGAPKEGGNRQRGSSGIWVITTTQRRRSSMRANDEERQIEALVAELLRRNIELLIRLNDATAEIAGPWKSCRRSIACSGRLEKRRAMGGPSIDG